MTNQERIANYGPGVSNQKISGAGRRTRPMTFLPNRLGVKAVSFRGKRQQLRAAKALRVSAETPTPRQRVRAAVASAFGQRRSAA